MSNTQKVGDLAALRQEIARQILAQQTRCPEHPMPFPKPSCWMCGRNGAFHRAALIAIDKFRDLDRILSADAMDRVLKGLRQR